MLKLAAILALLASLATLSAANFWPVIKGLLAAATHWGQCS